MAFVMESDGTLLGLIDQYNTLKYSRSFYKAGAFTMEINVNTQNALLIEKGRLLLPDEYTGELSQIYIIESIEYTLDEAGKENEVLAVSGRSLGGMFEERIALPPGGSAYDSQSGPAETVMKYYVDQNAGPSAAAARQIPNLEIAADLARGDTVYYAARYQQIAQILNEIALKAGYGWEITYNSTTNKYSFDVIPPVDNTEGSSDPVYFDVAFETIIKNRILSSQLDKKTYAYIGGEGEGTGRTIEETYLSASEPTGLDRKELFVDAGNISSSDDLAARGEYELLQTEEEDIIELDYNTVGPFNYLDDFDMGSIVTVRNQSWAYQADVKIIGVTVELTPNSGRPLAFIQLGTVYPTVVTRVNQAVGTDERKRV